MTLSRQLPLLLAGLALASPAAAQVQREQSPAKWEVEFLVGFGLAPKPTGGAAQLPPLGETFATGFGSGRRVPSWFFGDGAEVLNSLMTRNALPGRVTPLDPILIEPAAVIGRGAPLGVRVTRRLAPRWALELHGEATRHPLRPTTLTRSSVGLSETTLANTLGNLLPTVAQGEPALTTAASLDQQGLQLAIGGGVRFLMSHHTSTRPYIFLGGGVQWHHDAVVTVTARAEYEFTARPSAFTPAFPVHELDATTLRIRHPSTPFVRIGSGVNRDFGGRYGIHGSAMLTLAPHRLSVRVDARPESFAGNPTAAFVLTNTPRVVFSTDPGVPTSLSSTLAGFESFTGRGLRTSVLLSTGFFVRF